jgi:hypothetical protein
VSFGEEVSRFKSSVSREDEAQEEAASSFSSPMTYHY